MNPQEKADVGQDGEQLVQFAPDQNLDVMRFDDEVSVILGDPGDPTLDQSERPAVDTIHLRYLQNDQESFGLILRYDHERQGWRISQHRTFTADGVPEVDLAFLADPVQPDDDPADQAEAA